MKKIIQTIKLKKFKSVVDTVGFNPFDDMYFVLYQNGTYGLCWNKEELISELEKDHIKPIRYVVAKKDLIYIDRDIVVNAEVLNNEV